MSRTATLLAAVVLLAAAPAPAREVGGVDVPDTLTVEGKTLKLNGAGIRKKFIVKVYVGAMYLESPSTSVGEILKADRTRVVKMTFVRNVDKAKILDAYEEGFEKNSKGDLPKLQPALAKLRAGLGDMKSGQWMTVSYVPGKGVIVAQQAGSSVTIDADAKLVADALLRNWIGDEPADGSLKTELLAGK